MNACEVMNYVHANGDTNGGARDILASPCLMHVKCDYEILWSPGKLDQRHVHKH